MDVKERPQNVVTFVSFSELDTQTPDDTPQEVRIGGMDVLVNVDISNDVQAAVDLSADGSNRIDLRGGGNLTYTMNPLGDVRLSGKYVLSGGSVRYNPPVISPENLQNHAGQLRRMDRRHRRPGLQHHGRRDRAGQRLLRRAGLPAGEFRHLDQHPQLAQRSGDQFRPGGPRGPRHAEPAELADGRAARQPGDEPADLQHLHRPGNDRESQLRESAQHVHPEGAEPMGAEQPQGRGPLLRHRLPRRRRPQRSAHRLLLPALEKPLQQPRAGGHRRQVQHRRRPVAEPQGEPDRRHFAGIHAHQTRQHVPESLPPHGLREHPRRRDHRNGRGFRHPQETVAAGRPVQADASQNQKTERNESAAHPKHRSAPLAPCCWRPPAPPPGGWGATRCCIRA